MSLPRVFVATVLNLSAEFELDRNESAHLVKVLRLKDGAEFEVVDAHGSLFLARILRADPAATTAQVVRALPAAGEPSIKVVLVQGLPKGDKMDLVVQKATELGVAEIVPLACQHSVARYDPSKAAQKVSRWQKIAAEAAAQADRLIIPRVWPVQQLSELLAHEAFGQGLHLLAAEKSAAPLKQVLRAAPSRPDRIVIYIGPEGSFSESELAVLSKLAKPVSLGPRILRTETAGLAMISMIMYEYDQIMPRG
ncbi:MAG: 16S rRNA (uracil(1498)-N(3))-methyltransferase [Firmicutes bacterium]|nr:16S rRNA (uracil(1498)-N(3))-methyltransferase [Bacillota bacterium]